MRIKTTHPTLSLFLFVCLGAIMFSCNEPIPRSGNEQLNSGESALLQNTSEELLAFNSKALPIVFRKDTNVLLTVDTENITEENKNESVFISDDRSDNRALPSQHVAEVDKNMKIYWSAEALDPASGITVDVVEIFRKPEGGAEILDGVFRDPNKDGVVMGKIKNKKVSGMEYYNIVIRVNGDTPQTYVIDPKLKMNFEE